MFYKLNNFHHNNMTSKGNFQTSASNILRDFWISLEKTIETDLELIDTTTLQWKLKILAGY